MVTETNRANQAVQDVAQIVDNVRSTYMAANSFSAAASTDEIGNGTFIAAGIIPAHLVTSANSAANAWTGRVAVYENPNPTPFNNGIPANGAANGKRVFRVSFYKIPVSACIRIASQLAGLGTNDGPIQLITNGGGTTVNIPTMGTPVGLTVAAITAACNQNPTPPNAATSSVEFDYMIH